MTESYATNTRNTTFAAVKGVKNDGIMYRKHLHANDLQRSAPGSPKQIDRVSTMPIINWHGRRHSQPQGKRQRTVSHAKGFQQHKHNDQSLMHFLPQILIYDAESSPLLTKVQHAFLPQLGRACECILIDLQLVTQFLVCLSYLLAIKYLGIYIDSRKKQDVLLPA